MNQEIIIESLRVILPILIFILGALLAYRRYLKEKEDKKELIVNLVFGDLINILEHYSYAKNELYLLQDSEHEKIIRLGFFQFGKMQSLEKIDELGNLSPIEIRGILQLNLRIRNTDLILQNMLEKNREVSNLDITRLETRMKLCIKTSDSLIESIIKHRKGLKKDFEIIKTNFHFE